MVHLRAIAALLAGALIVLVGVVVLAATTLSDAPTEGDAPAAGDPGILTVTGDRTGEMEVGQGTWIRPGPLFFQDRSGNQIQLEPTADGGLFVDGMIFDGLNIFLDEGDCSVTETDGAPLQDGRPTVLLDIACPDVANAQGTATVTVEGTVQVVVEADSSEGA